MGNQQQTGGHGLTAIDFVLALLTLPVLLFVLMFATTGMTEMLSRPASRRRFGLILLAAEVVLIVSLVFVLQH